MIILITGAFGFVGTNLSAALTSANKHHLIAVDLVEPEHHNYSEYIAWDKLHTIGHKKIDAIIHLAGKAHDTRNTSAEQEYFDINLGLTQRIFEYYLQSGATKFIFFSSVKAVADTVPGEYLTEETTPTPGTPYGRSKLAAENYLQQNFSLPGTLNSEPKTLNSKPETLNSEPKTLNSEPETLNSKPETLNSKPETLNSKPETLNSEPKTLNSEPETLNSEPETLNSKPETLNSEPKTLNSESKTLNSEPETLNSTPSIFILRPCMIHGPGNKGNLNLLYRMVSKGIPWPLGAFENNRSFLSVDNLSFVISQIIQKEIAPGTYQVADDIPLSTNRIIELIAEAQKQKPRIWKLNKKLVQNFAHTGDIMHLPLNSERLQKLTESYVVSNQKLKTALGIDKMPFDAEEGMKKTLDSFK